MLRYAEMMRMKMPIKENDIDPTDDSEKTCPNPFAVDEDIIKPEPNYFTAAFDRERMKQGMFVIKDKESFFTNAQRSRVAYEILARMRYDDTDRDKFGIKRLINNGSFAAAYPLHEGKYKTEHSVLTWGADNERVLLFEEWARPGRWYKYQPLDLIRKYFGEKIAIYFTWLGYYTMMLIPASICGLVVFIYGLATLSTDIPSNEICDRSGPGNITMCPLCDKNCSYWRLYSSCRYSMVTYWFDNYGTMVFAVFMAVWATMFLEGWKRKQAEIEYEWDVAHFEEEEETVRPEFEATVRHKKKNPVTQTDEPFLPAWSKCFRYVTAFSVILFMLCLVLAAVFGVIIYRIVIVTLFYSTPDQLVAENARLATTATAAVINLVVIMILNRLYQFVALGLTNMELQRTQTEWEDSFTFKMFLFQCVNFYATLFYIAFFKGR
ncbi:anoctamin-4 isoform X1 [Lingula anatina]|uniref:Anoctamin n=1 Tax=Lingula anatina TaxID=7574 RepID=A0A1S3HLR3_LINAN|nr:anoctamin-4 isoform X1 [Lingula anatina]|eukprot:XP_013386411.1 anoctamin-4 isoform X1 [Lingula anatina]